MKVLPTLLYIDDKHPLNVKLIRMSITGRYPAADDAAAAMHVSLPGGELPRHQQYTETLLLATSRLFHRQ